MLRIDGEMITQALKIIHGGNNVSSMKLSLEEKKQVFKMQDDSVTEMTYNNLVDQHVRLPLQIYQQHFHLMKPQKYTLLDPHASYTFTQARKRNVVILCDWGENILKDLIRAGTSTNYSTKRYIGCDQVITRILYHALGISDELKEVLDEEHRVWQQVDERSEAAQRETWGRQKAAEEEASSDKDEQQPPKPSEETNGTTTHENGGDGEWRYWRGCALYFGVGTSPNTRLRAAFEVRHVSWPAFGVWWVCRRRS